MIFMFAQNHDNVAGLLALSPQPKYSGLLYPERVTGMDLKSDDDGTAFARLTYSVLTEDEYLGLLAALGLTATVSAEGTFRGLDIGLASQDYNVIVTRPANPTRRWGWIYDAEFLVTAMEEI